MTNPKIAELRELLARTTPVRPGWNLRIKGDGEERYELIGDPCGFPVAIFGDHNDAAFDLACRGALPDLLSDITRLQSENERMREALATIELGSGNGIKQFKERMAGRKSPTWYAVNVLQDYLAAAQGSARQALERSE